MPNLAFSLVIQPFNAGVMFIPRVPAVCDPSPTHRDVVMPLDLVDGVGGLFLRLGEDTDVYPAEHLQAAVWPILNLQLLEEQLHELLHFILRLFGIRRMLVRREHVEGVDRYLTLGE